MDASSETPTADKEEERKVVKLDRVIEGYRTTNTGLLNEINQAGMQVDFQFARIEALTQHLVELGILTPLQRLEEQLAWEKHLKAQLVPMAHRAREMLAEAQRQHQARLAQQRAEARRQQKGEAAKGEPPKLILPGQG